jgi:hypothetical protein
MEGIEHFLEVAARGLYEDCADQLVQVDQLVPKSRYRLVLPDVQVRKDYVIEINIDKLVRCECHHALQSHTY